MVVPEIQEKLAGVESVVLFGIEVCWCVWCVVCWSVFPKTRFSMALLEALRYVGMNAYCMLCVCVCLVCLCACVYGSVFPKTHFFVVIPKVQRNFVGSSMSCSLA